MALRRYRGRRGRGRAWISAYREDVRAVAGAEGCDMALRRYRGRRGRRRAWISEQYAPWQGRRDAIWLYAGKIKRQLEQERGAYRFRGFLGAFSTGDPLYAGASGEFGTESVANAELWSWEAEKECSASLSAGNFVYLRLKSSHTRCEIKEIKEKKLT